jgi:hypothetical protein
MLAVHTLLVRSVTDIKSMLVGECPGHLGYICGFHYCRWVPTVFFEPCAQCAQGVLACR